MAPPVPRPSKRLKKGQSSLARFFPTVQAAKDEKVDDEKQKKDQSKNISNTAGETDEKKKNAHPLVPYAVPVSSTVSWRHHCNSTGTAVAWVRHLRIPPAPEQTMKIAAFDLDGTLLSWTSPSWPSALNHYQLWNASVVSILRKYFDDGHRLIIISNQGAIRKALEGKRAHKIQQLIEWVAATVDRPLEFVCSFHKKDLGGGSFHKPSARMWTDIVLPKLLKTDTVDCDNSFFCGDSAGGPDDAQEGVDKNFAQSCGLKFYEPADLFGPPLSAAGATVDYQPPSRTVLDARMSLVSSLRNDPILLLLCGVQGSGKSTFAERLCKSSSNNEGTTRWVHFAQDTIQNGKPGKREAVEAAVQQALEQKQHVVVDRTHVDVEQRKHFLKLHSNVHILVLNPPRTTVLERVRAREDHPAGVQGEKGVRIAASALQKLQLPTYKEGFALISQASTQAAVDRYVLMYHRLALSTTPTRADLLTDEFELSNGVKIPSLVFGTMGWGQRVATEAAQTALELGARGFDTAPTYKNETKLGSCFRPDTFCLVKVPKKATTAKQVRESVQDSLKNLGLSSADLLLLHWPCDVISAGTLEEVWREMETLTKEGLARSLGVCNFNAPALATLLPHCTIRPAVNQVERHILLPQYELIEFCAQHDIVLQAHTPLGQGKSEVLGQSAVMSISSRRNLSPAQVVILWNIQQGVAVVPRCTSSQHIHEMTDLSSSDGPCLETADMKELNAVGFEGEDVQYTRFVAPPFMFGNGLHCWAKRRPGK